MQYFSKGDDTIMCLLCRGVVRFNKENTDKLTTHLVKQHNITQRNGLIMVINMVDKDTLDQISWIAKDYIECNFQSDYKDILDGINDENMDFPKYDALVEGHSLFGQISQSEIQEKQVGENESFDASNYVDSNNSKNISTSEIVGSNAVEMTENVNNGNKEGKEFTKVDQQIYNEVNQSEIGALHEKNMLVNDKKDGMQNDKLDDMTSLGDKIDDLKGGHNKVDKSSDNIKIPTNGDFEGIGDSKGGNVPNETGNANDVGLNNEMDEFVDAECPAEETEEFDNKWLEDELMKVLEDEPDLHVLQKRIDENQEAIKSINGKEMLIDTKEHSDSIHNDGGNNENLTVPPTFDPNHASKVKYNFAGMSAKEKKSQTMRFDESKFKATPNPGNKRKRVKDTEDFNVVNSEAQSQRYIPAKKIIKVIKVDKKPKPYKIDNSNFKRSNTDEIGVKHLVPNLPDSINISMVPNEVKPNIPNSITISKIPKECGYCAKTFSTSNEKSQHEQGEHAAEFRYKCNSCSAGGLKKINLFYHIQSKHLAGAENITFDVEIPVKSKLKNPNEFKSQNSVIPIKSKLKNSIELKSQDSVKKYTYQPRMKENIEQRINIGKILPENKSKNGNVTANKVNGKSYIKQENLQKILSSVKNSQVKFKNINLAQFKPKAPKVVQVLDLTDD